MSALASRPLVFFLFWTFGAPLDTDHLRCSPFARFDGSPSDRAACDYAAFKSLSSAESLGVTNAGIDSGTSRLSRCELCPSLPPSPSPRPHFCWGEAKVKVGGRTLLSSPSRARTLHSAPSNPVDDRSNSLLWFTLPRSCRFHTSFLAERLGVSRPHHGVGTTFYPC